jgi:phage internal scaffolding protein
MANKLRERRSVQVKDFGPGLTEQSHKKSTSMNFILDRYRKTGIVEHVRNQPLEYSDYINPLSYHEAMNQIALANSMFESLPSSIRKEFKNDPAEFLSFVQDERNYDSIKELGLSVSHLPEPKQTAVEPVSQEPLNDSGTSEPQSTP